MCTPTNSSTYQAFVPSIFSEITSLTSRADVKINTLFLTIFSRPYTEQVEDSDVGMGELCSNFHYSSTYYIEFNAEFTIDLYIRSVTDLFKLVIERIKREGCYGEIECELIINGDIKIDQDTTNPCTKTITKAVQGETATNVFEYELLGLDELPQNGDPETTDPETAV